MMIDIFDIIKKDICMPIAITGEVFSKGVPYNKNYIKELRNYLYDNEDEVELIQFETERTNIFNNDDEDYFLKFTIISNVTEDLYDEIMITMGDFIGYYDIELNKQNSIADNVSRRVPAGDFGLGFHDADGDVISFMELGQMFRPTNMNGMFQNMVLNLSEDVLSGRRLH